MTTINDLSWRGGSSHDVIVENLRKNGTISPIAETETQPILESRFVFGHIESENADGYTTDLPTSTLTAATITKVLG